MKHREFQEGVRALLVDKDKKPKWMHRAVGDVSSADVEYFFTRSEQCNLDITQA